MAFDRTTAKVSSRAAIAEAQREALLRGVIQQAQELLAAHERRVKIPYPALEKLVGDASKLMAASMQTDLLRAIITETTEGV